MKIDRNCKCDGHQRALASMICNFFDNKARSVSVNKKIAEELHKPIIKKFKRRKVYARFKSIVLVAALAGMGLLFSNNKSVKYLLCVIDFFTKYAWVKPLKDNKR